jgi:hypothetical protein
MLKTLAFTQFPHNIITLKGIKKNITAKNATLQNKKSALHCLVHNIAIYYEHDSH